MKDINFIKDGVPQKVNPNYFTGKTRLAELSTKLKTKESKIYHVNFFKGAKTKLHFHAGAQLLIVTKGIGSLVFFKKIGKGRSKFKIQQKEKINLKTGSIAYIPPKILHTHGSIRKNQTFSHIAVNFYPSKNVEPKTVWYESDFKRQVSKIL